MLSIKNPNSVNDIKIHYSIKVQEALENKKQNLNKIPLVL